MLFLGFITKRFHCQHVPLGKLCSSPTRISATPPLVSCSTALTEGSWVPQHSCRPQTRPALFEATQQSEKEGGGGIVLRAPPPTLFPSPTPPHPRTTPSPCRLPEPGGPEPQDDRGTTPGARRSKERSFPQHQPPRPVPSRPAAPLRAAPSAPPPPAASAARRWAGPRRRAAPCGEAEQRAG